MHDIVLHIGVGKTGSSSLQNHLSFNCSDGVSGTDYVYCAFDKTGEVIRGRKLREQASATGVGYAPSTWDIPASAEEFVGRLRQGILNVHSDGKIPIFSNEDWAQRAHQFAPLFQQLGMDVRVIMYVRPQVEYLNSGWWQWWAWMPEFSCPRDVPRLWGYTFLRWFDFYQAWKRLPSVKQMDLRLLQGNTVNDFLALLGSEPTETKQFNVSAGLLAIKLYKAFPELRRVHDAHVDTRLAPLLSDTGGVPWAINEDLCCSVIEATTNGNREIFEILTDQDQVCMVENQRWWSPDAYPSIVTPIGDLSKAEAIEILKRVVPILRGEKGK